MMPQSELGAAVPGGVYLCQVSVRVSCGACCGLYNVADASFDAMNEMLVLRTERFHRTARQVDAILEFKTVVEQLENQQRPLADFHHCPYIGLIGQRRLRVGCLLHPLAEGNQGVDYRGLSHYGGMACRTYFCPACYQLPVPIKRIVQHLAESWYDYGMIITEAGLLQAVFTEVTRRLKRPLSLADIPAESKCRQAVRELLELKVRWPYRRRPGHGVCHYFFTDEIYRRSPIDYSAVGQRTSRYDSLLQALNSHFNRPSDLQRAERRLDELFSTIAAEAAR